MKINTSQIAVIFLIIALSAISVQADINLPCGRAPFNLEYQLLYQKMVQSQDLSIMPPTGPVRLNKFARQLTLSPSLHLLNNGNENKIRLITLTGEQLQAKTDYKALDLFSTSSGFYYKPSSLFESLLLIRLDRERALDPDYTGKKWHGLAGDVEIAMISFNKGGINLSFGRQRLFWGPQSVNLILSETAEPLDMFSAEFKKGRLQFSFLFARLDDSRPDSADFARYPNYGFDDNRYLAGHRLDIRLFKNLRLGLFETSLFGGEGRSPELYYLNPLQFFHAIQLNDNNDDNTILGFDFTFLPYRGYSLYGQMIIDDFQIDNSVQGDQEPDEIGYMIGLFKSGKVSTFSPDLKIEYVRIANRTYHQRQARNRYLYRNELLGHPLDCDADSLSLKFRFWPKCLQSIEIETAYTRHGEGSIYNSWDEPWNEIEGSYSEPFPTGVVEKSFHIAAGFNGYLNLSRYLSEHVYFGLSGGFGSFINYHNQLGEDRTLSWLNLSINWIGFLEIGINE